MKKLLWLIIAIPVLALGQMKQIKYDAPAGTGVKITQWGHTLSAAVFLPEGYEDRSSWPTILWFTGAGEASAKKELSKLYGNGLPKHIVAGLSIPYIVIAIQPECCAPSPDIVHYVLTNQFFQQYKIDRNRIYTTGLSFGGGAALAMAIAHPEYISAVVSASPAALQSSEVANISKVVKAKIPVWFWAGTKDQTGPFLENAKDYMSKLIAAGGQAWLTTEPVGHGPWDNLYKSKTKLNGEDVYTFFTKYGKDVTPVPEPPKDTVVTKKLLVTVKIYDDGSIEPIKN
jgi:predicted peptidase